MSEPGILQDTIDASLAHQVPSLSNSPAAKRYKSDHQGMTSYTDTSALSQDDTSAATSGVLPIHKESLAPSSPEYIKYHELSETPPLQVKLLSDTAQAPTRGSAYAAGYDLYCSKSTTIPARGKAMVPTDISIAVPLGTYGRVAPRSGLASKHGINTGAGVIDQDSRGPVFILLFNHEDRDFDFAVGDRCAQLILERIVNPSIVVVEELDKTVRGIGGFGSTGGFSKSNA